MLSIPPPSGFDAAMVRVAMFVSTPRNSALLPSFSLLLLLLLLSLSPLSLVSLVGKGPVRVTHSMGEES